MKRFVDRGDFESAARETKAGFRGASEAREHILGQLGTLDAELRRKLASDIFDTRTALEQEHRATVEKLERRAAESETAITSRLSVVEPMAREGLDQAAKLFQELASAKEEASAATQVVQVHSDSLSSRVKRLAADTSARPSADEENEALQRLQYLEAQLGLSRVAGSETQAKSAPDSGGGPQTSQGLAKMNFVARQSALESLIEQNRRDLEDLMHRHCLDLDGLSRKVWGDKVPDGPPLAMRLAASEDQVSDLWRHVGNKAEKEDMLQRLSFKSDIGHTHDRLVSADGVATFVL